MIWIETKTEVNVPVRRPREYEGVQREAVPAELERQPTKPMRVLSPATTKGGR